MFENIALGTLMILAALGFSVRLGMIHPDKWGK
jgi:hypothetical protein